MIKNVKIFSVGAPVETISSSRRRFARFCSALPVLSVVSEIDPPPLAVPVPPLAWEGKHAARVVLARRCFGGWFWRCFDHSTSRIIVT